MDADERLERARQALLEGRPEEALEHLAPACASDDRARALEARARLALGDAPGARAALAAADPEHPAVWDARADLLLLEWRIDEARALLERLWRRAPAADVCERLALCADLCGDPGAADRWQARASELDPKLPAPFRLSPAEFERCVRAAAEGLPAALLERLRQTHVVVVPMPSREDADPSDPTATPPDMLGLFTGTSDLEAADSAGDFEAPPIIHLFQRNLERACGDRETLVQEIAVTLLHEFGHALGFDEEGVESLGLG